MLALYYCHNLIDYRSNAALLTARRRADPTGTYIQSGEDLANVGPVALLQDLAVMASLGIAHVERNGHHYFRGLAMFPPDVQEAAVRQHSDLYAHGPGGFAALVITGGRIALGSVNAAPFGLDPLPEVTRFAPVGGGQGMQTAP